MKAHLGSAQIHFYDKLGWYEIDVPHPGPLTYLGAPTSDAT